MPSPSDFPARGQVIARSAGRVRFAPSNTTYQLDLATESDYSGPLNVPIDAELRVVARKLYTVPSGGNFIQPIVGEPRIIQGRVVWLSESELIVRAGTFVRVALPESDDAIDMGNGEIRVGAMVNVVALPGAKFAALTPARV